MASKKLCQHTPRKQIHWTVVTTWLPLSRFNFQKLMHTESAHPSSDVIYWWQVAPLWLQTNTHKTVAYPHTHTHTHTRLTALCPWVLGWAGTRKVKPIWILLKQDTVTGSGISWTICKSAPRSRQITMPAPHPSVFCRPDALPATQPTASKHYIHIRKHRK